MCSGNHYYCFNDNDNKIVQPPIFRMRMIIIIAVVTLVMIVLFMTIQKPGSRYASRMHSKLLMSANKGNIIEGMIQK
jgi:hypothetical protein